MPGGCGVFVSSSALERDIQYSYRQKVEPAEIEPNDVETIIKFCLQKSSYQVHCTDIPQEKGLVQLSCL